MGGLQHVAGLVFHYVLKYCTVWSHGTRCCGERQKQKNMFQLQGSIEHRKKQDVLWQLTGVSTDWNQSKQLRAGSKSAPELNDTIVSVREL